jgi:hypothetical protein
MSGRLELMRLFIENQIEFDCRDKGGIGSRNLKQSADSNLFRNHSNVEERLV